MAASYCHDEPAAVWACACSPAQSFCVACLLRHVQDPGPHTVSNRRPVEHYLCGVCKKVTNQALSCAYPVCLCRSCVGRLSLAPVGEEMQAKILDAARPEQPAVDAEAVANEQAAQLSMRALFTQKRIDFRQRFFDSMNNFEEVIAQAIILDQELARCKERLRTAEAALAERNADMQRLQGQVGGPRDAGDLGQLAGLIDEIKAVSVENGKLKSDNQSLTNRVQALERQLIDQQSLVHQIESLSEEVATLKLELQETLNKQFEEYSRVTAEQVQEGMQEQLQAIASLTAMKVADVIPLVAHLKVDSEWLNSDTAENLFQLASLGISTPLDSANMRLVARVSLLLAKFIGPCEDMAAFSKNILTLVLKKPERGVKLLRNFETLYLRAKDEARCKEVIKGMMKLVGTQECEDSMDISGKFCKVLSLSGLCEFTAAISRYFCQRDRAYENWKGALLEVPMDWADSQLAEKCIESVLMVIVKNNFSEEYLALMRLMQVYRPTDETTLLTFVERAGMMLNSDSLKLQLHAYILETIRQIEFTRGIPSKEGQSYCELVCTTLKLTHEHSTAEELLKMSLLLREMNPRARRHQPLSLFVQLFAKFTAEEKLREFAFAALEWLFPNAHARDNAAFAFSLFEKLSTASDFEKTASAVGALLGTLAKADLSHAVESCCTDMLTSGVQLHQAAQVCLSFSSVRQETEDLMRAWKVLLDSSKASSELVRTVVALLDAGLQDSVFRSLQVFGKAAQLSLPGALAIVTEVHSVLRDSAPERRSMAELLNAALKALTAANSPAALILMCLTAWKDGRGRGATKIYGFCLHVLDKLAIPNMEQALNSVIAAFAPGSTAYEVVSTLLEMYAADDTDPSAISRQLTKLQTIRGAEVLNPLLARLKDRPMQPRHRALFTSATLDLCDSGDVQTITRNMESLLDIPETPALLEVLAQLQEPGVVKDFVGIAGRNPATVAATVQMASVFVELEAQGVHEVAIPVKVVNALLQRPAEVGELLPHVMELLQNRRNLMGALCIKVIGELDDRGAGAGELLAFVCDLARDLVGPAQPVAVVALCNAVLAARDEAQCLIVKSLQRKHPQFKDKLIELLNKVQDLVTLQDVEGLMPKHSQNKELVIVQSTLMRFFDFKNSQWLPPVQLKKQIECNSSNSCWSTYTILDDGSVLCCGGTFHAGYNSGRTTT